MNVLVLVIDQEGVAFHIVNNVKSTEQAEEKVLAKAKADLKIEDEEEFESLKDDWTLKSHELKDDMLTIQTYGWDYEVEAENLKIHSDD